MVVDVGVPLTEEVLRYYLDEHTDYEIEQLFDQKIEEWHYDYGQSLELYEYLGLTWEQYGWYVKCPHMLVEILQEIY